MPMTAHEIEWYEVTRDGEREVVSADHYHRHDWPGCTARPLYLSPDAPLKQVRKELRRARHTAASMLEINAATALDRALQILDAAIGNE
jgi:hypothetical protein